MMAWRISKLSSCLKNLKDNVNVFKILCRIALSSRYLKTTNCGIPDASKRLFFSLTLLIRRRRRMLRRICSAKWIAA